MDYCTTGQLRAREYHYSIIKPLMNFPSIPTVRGGRGRPTPFRCHATSVQEIGICSGANFVSEVVYLPRLLGFIGSCALFRPQPNPCLRVLLEIGVLALPRVGIAQNAHAMREGQSRRRRKVPKDTFSRADY